MLKKIKEYIHYSKNKYIYLLIGIMIVSHIEWLDINSILAFSDWRHWNDSFISTFFVGQGSWQNIETIGTYNIQIYFFFFQSIWALIVLMGGTFDIAVKITILIPIMLLGVLTPYFYILEISKNKKVAFLGALFYSTTTYFLIKQEAHLLIAFIYAIIPFIFLYLHRSIHSPSLKNWGVLFLIYNISVFYEVRIMYITTLMMILYFLIFFKKDYIKTYIKNIFLFFCFSILIHLFWILPLLLSHSSDKISEVANRGLFGNQLFDIWHAISIHESSWTGGYANMNFEMQKTPWYFFICPFLAFFSFVFFKPKKWKYYFFFGIISFVGIFLTKQSAEPFPGSYLWVYENIPGFNLFREASKFYMMTAFGYMGLITLLFQSITNKKYIFYFLSLSLIIPSFINLKPLITQEFDTLFVSREIPSDYSILEKSEKSDNSVYRTLWVPFYSQWSFFSYIKQKTSIINILYKLDKKNIYKISDEGELDQEIFSLMKKNYFPELLDILNIRDVIIPIQDKKNNDDFFIHYGGKKDKNIRKKYIKQMDKAEYLSLNTSQTKEVKVYKNHSVKPYIHTFSELIALQDISFLEEKYSFISSELQKKFYFILLDKNTHLIPHTSIQNIFVDNISNILAGKSLYKEKEIFLKPYSTNTIYKKYHTQNKITKLENKYLLQSTIPNNLLENNKIIDFTNNVNNYVLDIKKYSNIVIKNGTEIKEVSLNKNFKEVSIGEINNKLEIYNKKKNILKNGDFENSLWVNKVSDCNNYDKNGILGMKKSSYSFTGNSALEFSAEKHTACTSQTIKGINSQKKYLLSFAYQGIRNNPVGYYIGFNDKKKSSETQKIVVKNGEWNVYNKIITVPKGANKMEIFFYGYSHEKKGDNIITRYDNISVSEIDLIKVLKHERRKEFIKKDIAHQKNKFIFDIKNSDRLFFNRFPNNSFEKKLWNNGQVGDCNNYDKNPQIFLKKNNNDSSEGKSSLEISAIKHNACISQGEIAVTGGRKYLIKFDYKGINTKQSGMYIGFNNKKNDYFYRQIAINNNDWNTFSEVINVPNDSNAVSPFVYAYESDGIKKNTILYDNFYFIELPFQEYYLKSEPEKKLKTPQSTTFDVIDSTHKNIHIKGATTPFYIAMSEKYSPDWKLQFNNEKRKSFFGEWHPFADIDDIDDNQHFSLETFLNGWYFDTHKYCEKDNLCIKNSDGSYNIELVAEFKPQRWLYLGGIISISTFFLVLGVLVYILRKEKRKKLPLKKHWDKPNSLPPQNRY